MSALHVKKHGGLDRSWRLSCRALLGVFGVLDERGHHVQRGGSGHSILLPALDGALGDAASVRELLGGKPRLGADRLDAWCVVHHAPIIREDDRDSVGAAAVVAGDLHGSESVESFFRLIHLGLLRFGLVARGANPFLASPHINDLHADAVDFDGGDTAAVAGLGLAEVLADGADCGVIRSGADGCFVAGETVADDRDAHCLGRFRIVGRCVLQLRRQYATLRKPQELFTQACVFIFSSRKGLPNKLMSQENEIEAEKLTEKTDFLPSHEAPCSAVATIRRHNYPHEYRGWSVEHDSPKWTSDRLDAAPVPLEILVSELNKIAAREPNVWAVVYPQNVKEHAPALATPNVETEVEVKTTLDNFDNAASDGCSVSSCSASSFLSEEAIEGFKKLLLGDGLTIFDCLDRDRVKKCAAFLGEILRAESNVVDQKDLLAGGGCHSDELQAPTSDK